MKTLFLEGLLPRVGRRDGKRGQQTTLWNLSPTPLPAGAAQRQRWHRAPVPGAVSAVLVRSQVALTEAPPSASRGCHGLPSWEAALYPQSAAPLHPPCSSAAKRSARTPDFAGAPALSTRNGPCQLPCTPCSFSRKVTRRLAGGTVGTAAH